MKSIVLSYCIELSDLRCADLPNAVISSCNSDNRVGYEGDTCIFTCNTGYELSGSNTRTCQSDGNWSGTAGTMCRRGVLYNCNCIYCTVICVFLCP